MDRHGIPLAFKLFPGNESEKVHMRPILKRRKKEFSKTRTIIVADRGLNTSDNIYFINENNKGDNNPGDGYLYRDYRILKWVRSDYYDARENISAQQNTYQQPPQERTAALQLF